MGKPEQFRATCDSCGREYNCCDMMNCHEHGYFCVACQVNHGCPVCAENAELEAEADELEGYPDYKPKGTPFERVLKAKLAMARMEKS